MEKRRLASASNWPGLPEDLLDSIIPRLVYISDYIRFSAVCKSWNSVALKHKQKRERLTNHQYPLLLLISSRIEGCTSVSPYVFNFMTKSGIQDIQLHRFFWYGRCRGCLIYIRQACYEFFDVRIMPKHIDDFGTPIDLPRLCCFRPGHTRPDKVKSVVLSRDPCFGSFDVLITSYSCYAAHMKFDSKNWTCSGLGRSDYFASLVFYKDHILGASNRGGVLSLDVNIDHSLVPKGEKILPDLEHVRDSSGCFLVEATNGDLLMVLWYHDFDIHERYKLYKLLYSNGQHERIPIANLSGDSIFWGINHPVSVLASDYPGLCRPNSIYLICQRQPSDYICEEFNFEDRSMREDEIDEPYLTSASWIVPPIKL
ncbi:hypothetical protein FNV43_RR02156 [Rhamnella rubrinervis]|uniref:F-box protein n=1 Tax=Rhamnella rubrinervis TaxID=2594499 RepID=A0A8K0HTD1_9ROSA|nr:hypothetical protein FNV43_RR02156 [Rhamnella rubrinervis]